LSSIADIVPSFYLLSDLIIVRAITPVHASPGKTGGVVDLPIQRDEYHYPCIYSSSLKGTLKAALLQALLKRGDDYPKARMAVQTLLGPEPEEGESFESSIAILDAYLFAIPVRSLEGVYAYVTSPLLLRRFHERLELLMADLQEDRQREGKQFKVDEIIEKIAEEEPGPSKAICIGEDRRCGELKVSTLKEMVVLAEEYFLDIDSLKEAVKDIPEDQVKELNNFVRKVMGLDKPLLVVSDEMARGIIERSILRFTRIRLKRETKTVDGGPWTEEYLPPKTVLHSMTLYKKPSLSTSFMKKVLKKEEQGQLSEDDYFSTLRELQILNDDQIERAKNTNLILGKMQIITKAVREKTKDLVNNQLRGYLILGGHETIGKGIVSLKLLSLEELKEALGEEGEESQ